MTYLYYSRAFPLHLSYATHARTPPPTRAHNIHSPAHMRKQTDITDIISLSPSSAHHPRSGRYPEKYDGGIEMHDGTNETPARADRQEAYMETDKWIARGR